MLGKKGLINYFRFFNFGRGERNGKAFNKVENFFKLYMLVFFLVLGKYFVVMNYNYY